MQDPLPQAEGSLMPSEASQGALQPRPVIMRPDPTMKVSASDWEVIKALYCNGEKGQDLAKRFGISRHRIVQKAREEQWPTPGRIKYAQRKPEELSTDDPAKAVAELWMRRKDQSREDVYQGSRKALQRFFAHSPVPQTFAEAEVARKMMDRAIDPTEGRDSVNANVNLAILTQQGFAPKPVKGRVVEPED